MEKKSSFTSSLGFILAAAGSAVGVGNIWRFPYLAAKDGGGLFLLVYLILDIMDYISNSFLMPLISLLTCIFVGWVIKPKWIDDEMESSGHPFPRKKLYSVMIRFVAPVLMAILFVTSTGIL